MNPTPVYTYYITWIEIPMLHLHQTYYNYSCYDFYERVGGGGYFQGELQLLNNRIHVEILLERSI